MIATLLISQQNNIIRIRRCVENICEKNMDSGVRMKMALCIMDFQSSCVLAGLEEDALMECNLEH